MPLSQDLRQQEGIKTSSRSFSYGWSGAAGLHLAKAEARGRGWSNGQREKLQSQGKEKEPRLDSKRDEEPHFLKTLKIYLLATAHI